MYPQNRRKSGTRFVLTALRRGLSKRCLHCGHGSLFSGWGHHLPRCSRCELVYERNAGDTWFFTIVGDRLPVAIGVVLVYFGFARSHSAVGIVVFAVMIALLVWTSPNRWGVGIALHYLSRAYFPDPADPIPDERDSR